MKLWYGLPSNKTQYSKALAAVNLFKKEEEEETLASQEMNKDRAGIDRPSE